MSELRQGKLLDYGTREAWLAGRRDGVGASEVAILFGLAPASWGSPYTLWLQKTGRADKVIDDSADYFEIGRRMEPVVADMYEDRAKRKLWAGGGPHVVVIDPELEVLRATPDRWIVDAPGMPGNGVLETKNVGFWMTHNWDESTPPHVECQVQCQAACTGVAWGSAAGILGGNSFVYRDMVRNEAFIAEVRATVADFWKYVTSDTPPPIDGSEATARAIKRLHPRDSGDEIGLPPAAAIWWQTLVEAKTAMVIVKKIEGARADEAENKLREAIGSATFGVLPDGRRLTLYTTERHIEPRDEMFRQLRLESTTTKKRRK
jgi:putative phage-type endonuclease